MKHSLRIQKSVISSIEKSALLAFHQAMIPLRIKAIRKKFRLSQVKFADFIGISYDTYRNWEIGHRYPCGPAVALLYIAETQPDVFKKNRKKTCGTHLS